MSSPTRKSQKPRLRVRNLVKDYGSYRAVDNISFDLKPGQILGFLGPNGAGKTTTIQILIGITSPTAGSISYFGHDFQTHKQKSLQRINFTSAFNTLQNKITVEENLLVYSQLYQVENPREKIKELVQHFEIEGLMNMLYQNLSAGQKTRVNLCKSLLNDPEILLMDEPTASLDPDIADKTLTFIEQLRDEQGISILYTSHIMEEVTRLCNDVIILDKGKIVAHDTPQGLTKRISDTTIKLSLSQGLKDVEKYLIDKDIAFDTVERNTLQIHTKEEDVPDIIFGVSKAGGRIADIEINKPTLKDVFIQIARKEHVA